LAFAGSYISKTTIVKYLELYDKSWIELHRTMKNRHDYPERTIITTWQISFDEVKLRNEDAAKLLQLWGYLDNQELWFQLLQWQGYEREAPSWLRKIVATEISFLTTIDILLTYSLIERNDNTESYSLHAVVHDWIRASINEKNDESLLEIAITTIGLAVPEDNVRDSMTIQRRLLPHVIRWSQHLGQVSRVQQTLDKHAYLTGLHKLGDLYRNQGRFAEAEAISERALAGKERVLGAEHTSTLQTVNNLGNLYRHQGRLAEAEAMYERALAGYERALGAEHTSTLDTVNNLGVLYRDQGRLAEAEAMSERALAGYERVLGAEHTSTLHAVSNLQKLYKKQGRLLEADTIYQPRLERTDLPQPDPPP
jgi:tetratricopeptide (TPR) repeat protein